MDELNTRIERLISTLHKFTFFGAIAIVIGYPITVTAILAKVQLLQVFSDGDWWLFCAPICLFAIAIFPYFVERFYNTIISYVVAPKLDDIREAVLSLQQEARAEPNRNEAVEELVSVTKLYNSGCLYLGGTRISANHYNTVLTHARKSWLKRGLNNEKLATQSDLIAAGYTLTNNQNTSDVESSKMAAYPLQTPN
jgi:hypothetical protein